MKKYLFLFIIPLLFIACKGNNHYTIQVRIENGPDSLIVFNHWYVSSDTVLIQDGMAVFEGVVDSFPRLVSIGFLQPRERTQLVLEPGNIEVFYEKGKGFRIGGTKNNETLQKLQEELQPYDRAVREHWNNWHLAYNRADRSIEECEYHFDLTEKAREKQAEKVQKLIRDNPNFAGFVIALPSLRHADAATLAFYLEHFVMFSDCRRYKNIETLYEKVRTTTAGHQVEDFVLPDPAGNMVALSDFRGKWVLIDFWYTGCGWCIRMTPHLANIYNDWRDERNFEILAVSVDRPQHYEKWLEMVKNGHASWTQVIDTTGTLPPEKFGVSGYPALFLIDPEGRGTIKILGYQEEGALRRKLGEYVR